MRDFKGMKRQRNRNRSGGGGGGGGKPQHNANRAFDSNGPEGVKVRGAAQHVYEKYQQLARDATTSGDRVLAENYLQHAEHYFRVMRAMQPQRPVSEIIGRDQFVSGFDIDFEDESLNAEPAEEAPGAEGEATDGASEARGFEQRPGEQRSGDQRSGDQRSGEARQERGDRQDRYERQDRFDRQDRGDRPERSDRNERFGDRGDRGERSFGARDGESRYGDRNRDERRNRDDRPRDDRPRDDRPRDDRRFSREARPESDPLSVVEPQATPLTAVSLPSGPVLRADDGDVSHAPAFLQARPEPRSSEGAEEPRPRRRRRTSADAAPAASDSED